MLSERYRLRLSASPHLAAEHDKIHIDLQQLGLPNVDHPLIVEGAGGLMVPLTRRLLYIDVFAQWQAPIILCARTALGTLNHTLLSIEALRRRKIPILGIALIGDQHLDNERTLREMGNVPILGRLPHLNPLTPQTLHAAFALAFPSALFFAAPSGGP